MDAVDVAQKEIERHVQEGISRCCNELANSQAISSKGSCHNCDRVFERNKSRLFCDEDCCLDYEKRNRQLKHRLYP